MKDKNTNNKKANIQKAILKFIEKKPAVSIASLVEILPEKERKNPKANYALSRCVKNLAGTGFLEVVNSDNQKYLKITRTGRAKLNSMNLEPGEALVSVNWDGFWRIVILSLPESRKSEREALRYLLKKAGFVCVKNTVWISPYPYEHLFTEIKKDLGLSAEIMIVVSDKIDPETHSVFLAAFEK